MPPPAGDKRADRAGGTGTERALSYRAQLVAAHQGIVKSPPFELVAPDALTIGDLVICAAHDDIWEERTARIVDIDPVEGAGVYRFGPERRWWMAYDYRLFLLCRHISLKRLDATGGPVFRWHRFSWNKTVRYRIWRV